MHRHGFSIVECSIPEDLTINEYRRARPTRRPRRGRKAR